MIRTYVCVQYIEKMPLVGNLLLLRRFYIVELYPYIIK